jgi:NAD(P)H-hydrate epimerase
VLSIGPGISRHTETAELVRTVVKKSKIPVVLDADGLNAFENRSAEMKNRAPALVITPHPGEMARLTGLTIPAIQHDRLNIARKFAREHDAMVVLKGHRTLVAQPDGTVWVNTTGNPGMATGGTGDILTGMIAGFMAQNPEKIIEAVIAAVHLHGLAGDVACESMGEQSLVATDLLTGLPEAFGRTRQDAREVQVVIGG